MNKRQYGLLLSTPDERDYLLAPRLASSWQKDLAAFRKAGKATLYEYGPVLDQDDPDPTGHCGGFGPTDWENTAPIRAKHANSDAHALYYAIVASAGYPNSEDGVEMRWVAKYLKSIGKIGAYAWASSLDEVRYWLALKSNLIVGTNWTTGMEEPDARGFIAPNGRIAGGHCYDLIGYDGKADVITLLNSWGDWGPLHGIAKIKAIDFWKLMQSGGEVIAGLEIAK